MSTEIMSEKLEQRLNDYHLYHHSILLPALNEIEEKVSENTFRLHQAIGFNMIIAHALDYILAIEHVRHDKKISRLEIMQRLDSAYRIEGGKFTNGKFRLIDAVNNSIKHINLDPEKFKNYRELIDEYGDMNFRLLSEESGIVYMKTKNYQFDYGRIILRNISKIFKFQYDDPDCILSTIDGDDVYICSDELSLDPSDPSTAIDRTIFYCNPICLDCGEGEDECTCEKFIFKNEVGEFNPDIDHSFNVEYTLAEISNSW
ncbi:TPA: hypothetical protein SK266_000628 [Yersinia enterocolitica]|nr:hypothetical protein [Yersinia enterocolitica]HEI6862110.1 hypothetical protein [Yersinia enterocolitica]